MKKNFLFCLLVLFVVFTALGPFNPFGSFDISENGNASSPVTLGVQVLFVISLIFQRGKGALLKNVALYLCGFSIMWTLMSVLCYYGEIKIEFWIQCVKLGLCIVLFYKLSIFLSVHPKWQSWAMLTFSMVSVSLSVLFSCGLLEPYTIWSGGRAYIFGENPNSSSTRMVLSFLFILYLVIENPLKLGRKRSLLLLFEVPLLIAIMASGSRGSFIVLMFCSCIYFWFLPIHSRLKKVFIMLIGVLMLSFTIYKIAQQNEDFSLMERLTATVEEGDDAGRTELSAAAIKIFRDNPVFGVGELQFRYLMRSEFGFTHTVHNLYWYVFVTTGLFGAFFFFSFIAIILSRVWRYRKICPFALVLFVSMLLIASKTGGVLTYITMWFGFALSTSLTMIKSPKIVEYHGK